MRASLSITLASLIATSATALAQGAPLSLSPPPGVATQPKAGAPAPAAANQPAPTIKRVNAYFNAISGLIADFSQTAPDGRRYDGKLYILRPGRMKFEYKPPSPLEIVSDGRTVAVRDRKMNTQDLYLVGQTPLKFLLRDRIDVAKDSKVISLNQQGNDAVLLLEDRQTVGGTSRIRITFNNADMTLKQWIVTDPQGQDTRVQLSNIDQTKRPDQKLFFIQEGQVETPR